tara:strand:+ start:3346 stop:4920 length:1575 start_codon:yes stop_codon:yes gene_type:complete
MKKWIFGTLVFVLVAIIATGIFFPNIYEDELKEALENQVLIQSDSSYSVTLEKLNISFWNRTVSADSLTVTPTNELEPIKSISASFIEINGIKWWTLIFNQFASFESVIIEHPFIEIYSRPLKSDTFEESNSIDATKTNLALSKFNFIIRNGKARLVEPSGRTEVMLEEFNLMATEVDIAQVLDGSRLPFLKELVLTGKKITWRLDEKLYRFEVGEFSFDRVKKSAQLKNLALIPVLPKYEFSRIKGYSTDRIEMNIGSLELEDLILDSLYIPRIQIGKLKIDQGNLEVFKNKTIASRSAIGYRALMAEEIRKSSVQIGIDSILIKDFDVSYIEHKADAKEPGSVFFKNITGAIYDLNTPGYPQFTDETLKMRVSTKFMNTTTLNLNVDYPLFNTNESHRVWGNLGRLETSTVNSTLLHLAYVETKSGVINSMKFDFTVDDRKAKGLLWLDYEDLALTFLKSDDPNDKNLGTKFKSFLANTIGINSDNTGEIESEEIDYDWDQRKGVFGYWWQGLLSGIRNTIR